MIKNLKEFKNATKRIQSILQTFEIKTPEAFRLSNSASLNFMARILGYENYNTIKAVLENNISKGNKVKLIKIRENQILNANSISEYNIVETGYGDNIRYEVRFFILTESEQICDFKLKSDAKSVLSKTIEFVFLAVVVIYLVL